jgi:hypothetical protein
LKRSKTREREEAKDQPVRDLRPALIVFVDPDHESGERKELEREGSTRERSSIIRRRRGTRRREKSLQVIVVVSRTSMMGE